MRWLASSLRHRDNELSACCTAACSSNVRIKTVGLTILGSRGLWKAMEQGRSGGDVLACPGEVREGSVVGEDPLVYITGRGACVPTIPMTLDLLLDSLVLPDEVLSSIIDLQLSCS